MIVENPEKLRRRTLGQVRTPESIAKWMTSWACAHRPKRILEPAAGDGVFIQAIAERNRSAAITAFEIDRQQITAMRRRVRVEQSRLRLDCRCEDFVTAKIESSFDAIVANPPYIRHHSFTYDESIWKTFDAQCDGRISRLTNIYGLFLLRIWLLLGRNGRAAIITPAEWLNADFGKALKRYLLRENAIDALVHFRPDSLVFGKVLTTAVITLLRRGRAAREPVQLVSIDGPDSLDDKTLSKCKRVSWRDFDPDEKWATYFEAEQKVNGLSRRLGDLASCRRGIATGANNYFTLRKCDIKRWGLKNTDVELCVTKAAQIAGDKLTAAEVQRWVDSNERVFLLNPKSIDRNVRKYLQHGQAHGIDRRFLPSHRPVWFMPERRPPAPILISVFSRGAFKVVLNNPRVLNLTAYHGIYPSGRSRREVLRLHRFLNSRAGQAMIARQRRVYGGGLYKLEPRDVEQIEIPLHCAG